jgi:phage terminase Nu1 subunit (DNA packaging protein)
MEPESPIFPRLNQRQMAAFLGIKPSRLEWAGKGGIVKRDPDGFYPCETIAAQWLEYERGQRAKGNRRSQLERERAALTRAKRELTELRLAAMREKLVDLDSSAGTLRAVCLRIRSPFDCS